MSSGSWLSTYKFWFLSVFEQWTNRWKISFNHAFEINKNAHPKGKKVKAAHSIRRTWNNGKWESVDFTRHTVAEYLQHCDGGTVTTLRGLPCGKDIWQTQLQAHDKCQFNRVLQKKNSIKNDSKESAGGAETASIRNNLWFQGCVAEGRNHVKTRGKGVPNSGEAIPRVYSRIRLGEDQATSQGWRAVIGIQRAEIGGVEYYL